MTDTIGTILGSAQDNPVPSVPKQASLDTSSSVAALE